MKKTRNKKLLKVWLVLAIFMIAITINARATDVVPPETFLIPDQVNDYSSGISFVPGIGQGIPNRMFQTFTPSVSSLAAVDLLLREDIDFPNDGYTTTINIRELSPSGSLLGPILGIATAFIPGPKVLALQVTVRFLFSTPINLIPGQMYVIEWITPPQQFSLSWMAGYHNPYIYGSGYAPFQEPLPLDADLVFTTYTGLYWAFLIEQLQKIIDDNPETPLADKIEDVLQKVETADEEFNKNPPDYQAVLGNLEGAVGDLEAAVKDGLLNPTEGEKIMDLITRIARQIAWNAIEEAIACGGDQATMDEAQEYLDEGDALRGEIPPKFKDAINKYKDALAKAESALP